MSQSRIQRCKYTWTNKRYRNRNSLILERLDRCVNNYLWVKLFPNSLVTHLPRTKFDHCSMLLELDNTHTNK
ncbi:hypothetical protein H5410_046114, partial [Solanum commersonii]